MGEEINRFYSFQLKAFLGAAKRHKLQELGVEWSTPRAGMFFWMKVNGIEDTAEMIMKHAPKRKFLMVPGTAFFPGNPPSSYVRASFTSATPEQMDIALGRFADL